MRLFETVFMLILAELEQVQKQQLLSERKDVLTRLDEDIVCPYAFGLIATESTA